MQKGIRPRNRKYAPPGADSSGLLVRGEGMGIFRSGRWLIKDVDLRLRRGEIVTLIGPNGSGKSTTAKAILGLMKLDAGRLWRAPGIRIGYVPQRLVIDWTLPLSVRRLMSLTSRQSEDEIRSALAEVEIEHLIDEPIQNLSGGEFQRALLARAVLRKPDLLVLDEPVQGVDFAGEIALYDLISAFRSRLNCGILLISHDLHIVMADTDTVICLNTHVCCSGSPAAIAEDSSYRKLFGPRAAEALAIYRHKHNHRHEPDGKIVPLGECSSPHDHSGGSDGNAG